MAKTELLALLREAKEGHAKRELSDFAYIAVVNTLLDAKPEQQVSPEIVGTARLLYAAPGPYAVS